MVRLIVAPDGDAMSLAPDGFLIENLNRLLIHVDGLLLNEAMSRDVLEILAEVSAAWEFLVLITGPDHARERVVESILEVTLS